MDAIYKMSKTGEEMSMSENKSSEVFVTISGEEKYVTHTTFGVQRDVKSGGVIVKKSGGVIIKELPHRKSVDSYHETSHFMPSPNSWSPNPETSHFMPSPNRSPKTPNPETPHSTPSPTKSPITPNPETSHSMPSPNRSPKTPNRDTPHSMISPTRSPVTPNPETSHSMPSPNTSPKTPNLETPHSMPSPTKSFVTPNPETSHSMPSPNRSTITPNPETLTRRRTVSRLIYSKPRSRFGEPPLINPDMFNNNMPQPAGQTSNSSVRITTLASPNGTPSTETTTRASSITPKTPLKASPRGEGVDEDEEIYKKVKIRRQLRLKKVKTKVLLQCALLLLLVGCLVASFLIPKLESCMIWNLELWKWFVLMIVIICGMLVTNWLMRVIVLLIEMNFLLRKKVLYFVHGLKKSVQVCIWFILILVTWELLFNSQHAGRSKTATKVLDYLTWTIVALLVGSILWLLKTLLIKILATSFHVSNFFDRIQESIFLQYVLLTLSGPPVMESLQNVGESKSELSVRLKKKGKDAKTKGVIDVSKLHQMKREKVSAWTMKTLVDTISNSGLSTFTGQIEESAYDEGVDSGESTDKEITNEMEAIAAAYHIFRNVAPPGSTYIEDIDLRRFMIKEEVDIVFPMIDVAETGQIDRKTLTEWVVKVFNARKALAYALDDTKTAVDELNKLVTVIIIFVAIIVWLLLTEIATTKILVFLSSQLVVAAFIFGNTCKTVFEAIVFVFMMHPFDVGDRCVIDGVQMVVEEMNILNTVFLRFDNEKIYYPNSVLSTKPISNFYRSPDMGDKVEFSIDFATPFEKIGILKDKIKKYLEGNPQLWHPNHNFLVNEILNVNMIKVALTINHTMNFQDYGEKSKRRSELVLELKKIFEELDIKFNLLPQEVHLKHMDTTTY